MTKTHTLSIVIQEHDRPKQTHQPYLFTTDTIYLGPRTVINLDMETRDGDLMNMLHQAKRQIELAMSELDDSV